MQNAICKMNWNYSGNVDQPLNYRQNCYAKYYDACDYAGQNCEVVYSDCSKTIESVEKGPTLQYYKDCGELDLFSYFQLS